MSVPDSELPGGGGGRTEGLLQLFNVVVVDPKTNTVTSEHDCNNDAAFCYDWNTPPQNPNPQLRGRLRASFWNIIRKETALKDTAFMVIGHQVRHAKLNPFFFIDFTNRT